jgi:ketosteroid isomerase-like protein
MKGLRPDPCATEPESDTFSRAAAAKWSGKRRIFDRQRVYVMVDRLEIEQLLHGLYAARLRGDLNAVCRSFSEGATFQIAGASNVNPMGVKSVGIDQFGPLLALMIKSFKLSEMAILSMIIDGVKAAVHWRVKVHSKITGTTVLTELVDLVEVNDGHIASYIEYFVPCSSSLK